MLERYRDTAWAPPLHPPSCRAFGAIATLLEGEGRALILDSGCGTGESTRALAVRFPDHLVIGVDKSAARLARAGAGPFPLRAGNAVWVRAELASFWRLARQAGLAFDRHYLLYPNPWPKPGHLQRRWHAHPVFSEMLGLGGRLEMRTNWRIYADEFAFALGRLQGRDFEPAVHAATDPLTPFERKYRNSGHVLYSVVSSSSGV